MSFSDVYGCPEHSTAHSAAQHMYCRSILTSIGLFGRSLLQVYYVGLFRLMQVSFWRILTLPTSPGRVFGGATHVLQVSFDFNRSLLQVSFAGLFCRSLSIEVGRFLTYIDVVQITRPRIWPHKASRPSLYLAIISICTRCVYSEDASHFYLLFLSLSC